MYGILHFPNNSILPKKVVKIICSKLITWTSEDPQILVKSNFHYNVVGVPSIARGLAISLTLLLIFFLQSLSLTSWRRYWYWVNLTLQAATPQNGQTLDYNTCSTWLFCGVDTWSIKIVPNLRNWNIFSWTICFIIWIIKGIMNLKKDQEIIPRCILNACVKLKSCQMWKIRAFSGPPAGLFMWVI